MSFAEGFAVGMLLGSGGGSGDDDIPSYLDDPDYALYQALPEPADNQFILLIRITDASSSRGVSIQFGYTEGFSSDDMDDSAVIIDWGDGSVSPLWNGNDHKYGANGDYTITVTDNTGGRLFLGESSASGYQEPVAAKIGKDLLYSSSGRIYGLLNGSIFYGGLSGTNLKYIKLNSDELCRTGFVVMSSQRLIHIDFDGSLGELESLNYNFNNLNALYFDNFDSFFSKIKEISDGVNYRQCFSNCYNLKKLELPNCKKIGNNNIPGGYNSLEEVVLPNCEEIGANVFTSLYGLKKISLPKCKTIGDGSFYSCYNLIGVEINESCTYGNDVFKHCWLLSPAPNGKYPYMN